MLGLGHELCGIFYHCCVVCHSALSFVKKMSVSCVVCDGDYEVILETR